jgi:hypothetical protein
MTQELINLWGKKVSRHEDNSFLCPDLQETLGMTYKRRVHRDTDRIQVYLKQQYPVARIDQVQEEQ